MAGPEGGVIPSLGHTPERVRALRAIVSILKKGKKSRDALDAHTHLLEDRDRAFVMEIVYGVLRYRDYLDFILRQFITKWNGLSPYTVNNLRMAVYQILFMRVPERASVFEAVEIEKSYSGKPSLVNAVLREILRQGIGPNNPPPLPKGSIRALAIETSHPEWLLKRWFKHLGHEEARQLAIINNSRPPLSLRLNSTEELRYTSLRLEQAGIEHRVSEYIPNCLILLEAVSFHLLMDLIGVNFAVQDEASQMVSLLLDPKPDMTVLDSCAAPGGKTAHMASLMNNTGTIYAVEIDKRRHLMLEDTLRRLDLKNVVPICGDVLKLDTYIKMPPVGFDRVMLDAPCSGLGVIRRKPDIKYRHRETDLKEFAVRQLKMLNHLCHLLRPGGILLYSVCSTEPEEAEEVLARFLQKNSGFSNIESPQTSFDNFKEYGKDGTIYYRTYPHRHNMDGFFVALIQRDR